MGTYTSSVFADKLCSQSITTTVPMESINDMIEAYDASEGKFSVNQLKELLKELRKSKVRLTRIKWKKLPGIIYCLFAKPAVEEAGYRV